jgi:hypothetical protein
VNLSGVKLELTQTIKSIPLIWEKEVPLMAEMLKVIHYAFVQKFNVSAHKAYEWCTDYGPSDMALMQKENTTRKVQRISRDTIILVDTFVNAGKPVVKQKLVCLYPDQLSWTATHLTGPNKYSQFLYKITPESKKQCLFELTALYLDYGIKENTEIKRKHLARKLRKMDSDNWKLLAKTMENDLNARKLQ